METTSWVIIDTETTGFKLPIIPVELAAQKMIGWERDGAPFRRLLNQNCAISSEAARVHGYTAEILERDGDPPEEVYSEFEAYAGGLPVVAYNLQYDWDQVLVPDWERLSVEPIGKRGFCAYKLAQRLLDPVPAGNCKLQTLRQYYRLPERGAHTALGDVDTVIDLMQNVLNPIAENRNLHSWNQLKQYSEVEWYPSRLPFGKFKGRPFYEATDDSELRKWLQWLAESSNSKSSRMGQWYIQQLDSGVEVEDTILVDEPSDSAKTGGPGLMLFQHLEIKQFERLIEAARGRLAELELEFSVENAKVDSIRAQLFEGLRSFYQERDRLRLLIQYRNAFLDRLLSEGEEAAEETTGEYKRASTEQDGEYDSTASALEGKRELSKAEKSKLKKLWRMLVRMFHPDQYEQDPEKKKTYELLTQAINEARDRGDIELLERIAKDPQAFILQQGWASIELDESRSIRKLRSLYDHLQARILELIETLDSLRASADYELFKLTRQDERVLGAVIGDQKKDLETELQTLRAEAEQKAKEIEELTSSAPF